MRLEFQGFLKVFQAFKDFNLDKKAEVSDLYFKVTDCDKIGSLLDAYGLTYSFKFDPTIDVTVDLALGMVNFSTQHIEPAFLEQICDKLPNCNIVDKNATVAECQLDQLLDIMKELNLETDIKYKKFKKSNIHDITP